MPLTVDELVAIANDSEIRKKLTLNFLSGTHKTRTRTFKTYPATYDDIPDLLQETWMLLFRKRENFTEAPIKDDERAWLINWAVFHAAAVARRRDIDIFGLREGREKTVVNFQDPRFYSYNVKSMENSEEVHEIGDLFPDSQALQYSNGRPKYPKSDCHESRVAYRWGLCAECYKKAWHVGIRGPMPLSVVKEKIKDLVDFKPAAFKGSKRKGTVPGTKGAGDHALIDQAQESTQSISTPQQPSEDQGC